MKISYAITVCNELNELERLINILLKAKDSEDEIVVLCDEPKSSKQLLEYLDELKDEVNVYHGVFKNDFSEWKNKLNGYCIGDYIFNIDADEYPSIHLITNLKDILTMNPEIDYYLIPRENTVEGITPEYIQKWRWIKDDKNRINYPDYQGRLYKNKSNILWNGKVHERITGYLNMSMFPQDSYFDLYHPKTIEKQIKQNNLYNQL